MNNKTNVFLAIDDKIENLISLKALLKESFPQSMILTAQNGRDGIELAQKHDPDVILLDVMMPDMNGYEVCQILKADPVLQDIPVVFVTALSGDRETRLKAVENGAEAFIHKPIDELELQIQMRTLLRLRYLNVLKKERIAQLVEGLTDKTEALDASEQRFKIMVNSISDTIGITDIHGKIMYRSPNNARLFGVDPDETIGKNSFDFVHPDDRERVYHELEELVKSGPGATRTGEFRYLRHDGSSICVELEGRNMVDDPIINGLLLTYRDITERKEAARKLEEESEKLRALIESTEDLVWLVDPEHFGLITYNSALYHYFETGRGLSITPGMTPDDLLPEQFAQQWHSMYTTVLQHGAYKTEYSTSAMGKTLSLSFYPVKIEGVVIGISVLGQDITEKKKIEVALAESEERFRGIVNSMDDVVYTMDNKHRHTGVFGGWIKKSNLTEAHFIGKTSTDIFGEALGKVHEDAISTALLGQNVVYEWTVSGDAEKIYYQTSLSPMFSPNGRVQGIVGIGRNITNIKKAEVELIASKERFIQAQEMGRFGHWSFNMETQTFDGSKVTYDIYGLEHGTAVSFDTVIHCIIDEDVQRITSRFNELIQTGHHFDEQFRIRPYGSENLLSIRNIADLSIDENGNTIIAGVVQDLTELKKLEQQIQEKSQQNQRILDNLQDAYFQADLTGTLTLVNPKALQMYGYSSSEELIGLKSETLYDQPEVRQQLIERLKQNGYLTDFVGKGRRKDGTSFWVSMNVQYVRDVNGKIIGTEGLVRDISERIEMEEAIKHQRDYLIESNEKLQKSELKFKTMLETIPAALFLTVDNHTKIEYLSSYFTEMLGYTYEDLPNLDHWFAKAYPNETYRQQVINETTDSLMKSLADPTYKTEMISNVTCKDGSVKHMVWRGLMLDNQWLGCGFDLTRIHEANQKLQERLRQSVVAISKIGEMRDVYTAGHQKRVQQLSIEIAKRMNLPEQTIQNITYGALIHDIGKIYIASDILNKPGKISNLEYQILQTHAEHGYEIAKEIDFVEEIPLMIYQHHERLDGSGYPLGLKGEQILLESRILAVADVVEAMTSHRPYRAALGIEVALKEIEQHKGIKYDQQVVDVCLDLFNTHSFTFVD